MVYKHIFHRRKIFFKTLWLLWWYWNFEREKSVCNFSREIKIKIRKLCI